MLTSGSERRTAAASAVGDADLREMLALLGLAQLQSLGAHADAAQTDPVAEELRVARDLARGARDFATRGRAARATCASSAGRSATTPRAPSCCRWATLSAPVAR